MRTVIVLGLLALVGCSGGGADSVTVADAAADATGSADATGADQSARQDAPAQSDVAAQPDVAIGPIDTRRVYWELVKPAPPLDFGAVAVGSIVKVDLTFIWRGDAIIPKSQIAPKFSPMNGRFSIETDISQADPGEPITLKIAFWPHEAGPVQADFSMVTLDPITFKGTGVLGDGGAD